MSHWTSPEISFFFFTFNSIFSKVLIAISAISSGVGSEISKRGFVRANSYFSVKHLVLCRTSNRSMLTCARLENCAFVLAQSSKLSFFVHSCTLEVWIRVRHSEILAEHINVFRILLHKSTTYLMFFLLDVQISNARWCSCSKILKNQRSHLLDTRKICVRHNTKLKGRE